MTREDDLLRRSMSAVPEEWLDRLVTERVVNEVRRECALRHAQTRAEPAPSPVPSGQPSLAHGR